MGDDLEDSTPEGEAASTPRVPRRMLVKAVAASIVGNIVEWYDFAIYGFLVPIIATQFFPAEDRTASLLATYLVYAVAFLVRPFGGAVWGYLGDRLGRQQVLMLTIVSMSVGTFAIGLLPTYATLGVGAAILLVACRLLQGVGASGEYSTAAAFIVEYGPRHRRALRAGFIAAGVFVGVMFASGLSSLVSAVMTTSAFEAWGWRILFLLTGPLAAVGFYIRYRIDESPDFRAVRDRQETEHTQAPPFGFVIRTQWRTMLVFVFLAMPYMVGGFVLTGYFSTYLIETVGLAKTTSFAISTVALTGLVIVAVGGGWAADRLPRKGILLVGCGYLSLLALPIFLLANIGGLLVALAAELLLVVGLFFFLTPMTVSLADMFPTEVRATSAGISYNVATALFGGTAPFVATWLVGATSSGVAPAFYLAAVSLVSLVAVAAAYREPRPNAPTGVT